MVELEITVEDINELIICYTPHKQFLEVGYRGWVAEGELGEIVYWDLGNGFCQIVTAKNFNEHPADPQHNLFARFRKLFEERASCEDCQR